MIFSFSSQSTVQLQTLPKAHVFSNYSTTAGVAKDLRVSPADHSSLSPIPKNCPFGIGRQDRNEQETRVAKELSQDCFIGAVYSKMVPPQ
jgi:hypothetical protein